MEGVQRIGGIPPPIPPIPPMPFMAPRIWRMRPLLPPLDSLDIIFSICMNCLRRRLTSAGCGPGPRARGGLPPPPAGHAGLARAVQEVGVTTLLLGHRPDDRDHALQFVVVDL